MKKLSLNNLNLGAENLLQKEQLKNVLGGFQQPEPNGFDCAPVFEECDAAHPNDHSDFEECMFWEGCLYDAI